jgi:hypothetical protein
VRLGEYLIQVGTEVLQRAQKARLYRERTQAVMGYEVVFRLWAQSVKT